MLAETQANYYGTTYGESYKCSKVLPPVKFHQLPALQLKDVAMLSTRGTFPLIQMGPHRRLLRGVALGPGLGSDINTERLLERKPIVRTEPPRDKVIRPPSGVRPPSGQLRRRKGSAHKLRRTVASTRLKTQPLPPASPTVHNIPQQIIDDLCNHVTWTSTAERDSEGAKMQVREVVPPHTTFEKNADMVKQRVKKYEAEPQLWQRVATAWDLTQSRPSMDRPKYLTQRDRSHPVSPTKLLPNRKEQSKNQVLSHKIMELVRSRQLPTSYDMPCPGYAGFVPRSPVEEPLEGRSVNPTMVTIMKTSYRSLPAEDYHIREHAHQGPMSRTVTLTYPYNPFNKVEERCEA